MRRTLLTAVLISLALGAQAIPSPPSQAAAAKSGVVPQRTVPCKVPENAAMCYWTRGRLRLTTIGLPTYRIWKVGTNRILGIYSGPSTYPPRADKDYLTEFPANLQRIFDLEYERNIRLKIDTPWYIGDVFADFEVCPLEPEKPGYMQHACVESAKSVFVWSSKHGYK
jgi:hypothetical protein